MQVRHRQRRYIGSDILCFGRSASGEVFTEGNVHQTSTIYREGRLVWHEQGEIGGAGPGTPEDPLCHGPPMIADAALLRLLQLASRSLPVGAYSYSQGPESAIDDGQVHDAASARDWIASQLTGVVARFDAPLQWRLLHAFTGRDACAVRFWSDRWLATRDTAGLRAETIQMGYSLRQLLVALLEDRTDTDPRLLPLLDAADLLRAEALPAECLMGVENRRLPAHGDSRGCIDQPGSDCAHEC